MADSKTVGQMSHAASAKPVPIRLAYRYPNGSMVSYAARALSYDGLSMRLVVNEGFDEGISLTIMAPFLKGLTTGRVAAVSRSQDRPGYFEVVVRFAKGNGAASAAPSELQGHAGFKQPEGAAARKQPARVVHEAIAHAAEELAGSLYRLPVPRFSQAIQWIPAKSRPLALLAAVAATVHLLEEKGLASSAELFRTVKGARRK